MSEYKVFLNGAFVPESQATVSVYDHGFLYGDGVFEGIRAYRGVVFKLREHVERLYESAKAIDLAIPYTKDEFVELVVETCRQNDLSDAYIRPIVARGRGDLGLDPRKCKEPTIVILAREFGALYGDKYERGLKIVTVSTRRNPPQCLSPNIKSLNYLNNILARIEVNHQGADEGIMLDLNGYVAEATADNIFLVKGGVVITPPTATSLKGITRGAVCDVARSEGFDVREEMMTLFDVYNADEVFITGTAAEIAPVVEVDQRVIGDHRPGRVTKKLIAGFHKYTNDPAHGVEIYAPASTTVKLR